MAAGVLSSEYGSLTSWSWSMPVYLVKSQSVAILVTGARPALQTRAGTSPAPLPPAQLLASDMEAVFDDKNKIGTCFCKIFFDWLLNP